MINDYLTWILTSHIGNQYIDCISLMSYGMFDLWPLHFRCRQNNQAHEASRSVILYHSLNCSRFRFIFQLVYRCLTRDVPDKVNSLFNKIFYIAIEIKISPKTWGFFFLNLTTPLSVTGFTDNHANSEKAFMLFIIWV